VQLSIVTGTKDRPECIKRLVYSVVSNAGLRWNEWELIIADASEKLTQLDHTILGLGASVFTIHEKTPLGMVKGYNHAFWLSRGKWVLWLNDDVEVLPGYDKAAVGFMEANPEIGLGALYYSEQGVQENKFHINHYLEMAYANFGIIRRDIGNELGWFDEDIKMYGSDNALSFKVLLAGKGVVGIPNAKLIHHAHQDPLRKENQKDRRSDARLLRDRYFPRVNEMRAVYNQYSRLGGPWEI